MKYFLSLTIMLACAACAATPEEVEPERISPLVYRERTCQELRASLTTRRSEEARLVAMMNSWPRGTSGDLVRRVDIGRELANVRGHLEAANSVYVRWNCAERLKYIG